MPHQTLVPIARLLRRFPRPGAGFPTLPPLRLVKTHQKLLAGLVLALLSWGVCDVVLRGLETVAKIEGVLTDSRHRVWMKTLAPSPEDHQSPVMIVDIDDRTLDRLGTYGEHYRTHHARLLEVLRRGGAGVVAFDVLFTASDSGKAQSERILHALKTSGIAIDADSTDLERLRRAVDFTASLEEELARTPGSVVTAKLDHSEAYPNPSDWIPYASREWQQAVYPGWALPSASLAALKGRDVLSSVVPALARNAGAVGIANVEADLDGKSRRINLLWRFPDTSLVHAELAPRGLAIPRAYPVLSLQAALLALGRRPDEMRVSDGNWIDLGAPLRLWRDSSGRISTSIPRLTWPMLERLRRRNAEIARLERDGAGSLLATGQIVLERRSDSSLVTRLTYPDTLDDAATRALAAVAGDTSWFSQVPPGGEPAALSDQVLVARDSAGEFRIATFAAPGGPGAAQIGEFRMSPEDITAFLQEVALQAPQGLSTLPPGEALFLSCYLEAWWDPTLGRVQTSFAPLGGSALTQLLALPEERLDSLRAGDTLALGAPIRIPVDATGAMLLPFRSASDLMSTRPWLRHVSFVDVLEGRLDPSLMQGRVIVVGSSAIGLMDFIDVPIEDHYPGVDLQATSAQSILTGDFLHEPGRIWKAAIIVSLALLAGAIAALVSPLWAFAATVGLCGAWYIASFAAFHSGVWLEIFLPWSGAVSTAVGMAGVRYLSEERQRRFLQKSIKIYLPPAQVDQMIESGEYPQLGGEEREITAFFSDIQGFSTFSEAIGSPSKLVELLNEYLGDLEVILNKNRGSLDKYIGDAIVAMFGAPLRVHEHPACAVEASVQMQERLSELRAKWRDEGDKWPTIVHEMRMRIGLNSGRAVTGNMGSSNRMNYTMMGDTVNLAARLESAAKQYGVFILASDTTVAQAGDGFLTRELDRIVVIGKTEPVTIHEVVGRLAGARESTLRCLETFAAGRRLYLEGRFAEAREAFLRSLEDEPFYGASGVKSCPSKVFAARCEDYLRDPPPVNWDGVYTATKK